MALPVQRRLRNKTGDKKLFRVNKNIYLHAHQIYLLCLKEKKNVPMEKEKMTCSEFRWNYRDPILKLLTDKAPY